MTIVIRKKGIHLAILDCGRPYHACHFSSQVRGGYLSLPGTRMTDGTEMNAMAYASVNFVGLIEVAVSVSLTERSLRAGWAVGPSQIDGLHY